MIKFPDSVEKLVNGFSRLPGVGPKTAQRLAFHILKTAENEALELASSINEAKKHVHHCTQCGNFTDMETCNICTSHKRDNTTICVIENPQDIIAVESSGEYNGLYHVLMGALSPLNGIGPEELKIEELKQRIKNKEIKEIIIATDPNVEGEATAVYLNDILREFQIKVTRLAHGIPVGGNLEYADGVTLGKAIEGRREF